MANKNYKPYLFSKHWRKTSKLFKSEKGYVCEMCKNHLLLEVTEIIRNRNHPSWTIPEVARFVDVVIECKGDKKKLIQVHHRSYKNKGHETDKDLACVCRPCHVLITENNVDHDQEKAWQITQIKVQEILKQIHNSPDGEREFAEFLLQDDIKIDQNEEFEEEVQDYFDYKNDFYDIQEEFE